MSSEYETIIGLEVHVQLKTASKLFCGCSTAFGAAPNTQTCPVCLGHPGVLPVMNRKAFELSVKSALAFGCEIASYTKWDRKHYYYPDLPKNFQISQYDIPFSSGGHVAFAHEGEEKSVRLTRIHLEEDAGKLIHDDKHDISLVDLNRTGTPLMEIVSEPDITSPEEAYEYLSAIKLTLQYLEVSDCNMQEGSLRCDANINIRIGDKVTPIAEVKNLNSFRGVEAAMRYEADRQFREFRKNGQTIDDAPKITVGWDADQGITFVQRSKEEAQDYRYFPEPDIPPFEISREFVEEIRTTVGELPAPRKQRFMSDLGLNDYDAGVLTQNKHVADYYEACLANYSDNKNCANFIINDVLREVNERHIPIQEFPVTPSTTSSLLNLVDSGEINFKIARNEVFPVMVAENKTAEQVVEEKGLKQVSDAGELEGMVAEVLDSNPKVVADYLGGKGQAIGFLMGQVMKATQGKANPGVVKELLTAQLEARR